MKTSIVILTRGRTALLRACLSSVKKFSPKDTEVIVVEHETQDAESLINEHYPYVRYFRKTDDPDRQSFSSLNNFGVQQATGDSFLILNNDIEFHEGCIEKMQAALDTMPDVGIVGAKLLFADGTIQHMGVCFNAFGIPSHLGYKKDDGPEFPPSMRSDYFDAVTFACALVRREVWEKLGGLDTDYFFNYEDTDFCLRAREMGWKTYVVHDAIATHHEGQSMDFRTTKDHSIVRNIHILRKKWINTGRMEKILKMKVMREYGPLADDRLNIAFMPGGKEAGVSWWRMQLPAKKLLEQKLANIEFVYGDMNEKTVQDLLSKADLTVWQSYYSDPIKRIAAMGSDRGFKMVYEYDDHPVYLSPYAQVFRNLGTKEVKIASRDGEEVWLWRDGQDGFDLERNRRNRTNQLEIMTQVDALTTTTEPLAGYFKTLNPNVYTLPNCIDFKHYRKPGTLYDRKPGPVRIGWWGGDNHWHDVSMIGTALTRFVNTHDVTLVLIGAFYKGPLKGIDLNKVEDNEWVHVEAFPWRLAAAALDVVVVPLAPPNLPEMQFNQYKSDIKFLEASAMGWPSLVQGGVRAYESAIDGVNALTYTDDDDFTMKLQALVESSEIRRKISDNAYDYTFQCRNLDKEAYRWLEAYQRIIKGHPVVNEVAASV